MTISSLRFSRSLNILGVLATLVACAPATSTSAAAQAPVTRASATSTAPRPPAQIHWFRNSAEMRGIYLEAYRLAGDQLDRLASGTAPGTWAVILDADETIIDNSLFEKRQDALKAAFTDSAWRQWAYQKAAPALPGAVEFTRFAHQLGGKVIIISNRESVLCDATRENIRKDSIDADLVLCRTTTGNKNPRFQSVINGTASPSLPALKVLMWLGDNIEDFPNLSQALRDGPDAGYDQFGRTYFLLPNPMYGSWGKVPYR